MTIKMLKGKEIVLRSPNPRVFIMPPPLSEIDQVTEIKTLGVMSWQLNFQSHINYIVSKSCQRFYLITLVRDRGLRGEQ